MRPKVGQTLVSTTGAYFLMADDSFLGFAPPLGTKVLI